MPYKNKEANREYQKKYARIWRKKYPEKIKKALEKYYYSRTKEQKAFIRSRNRKWRKIKFPELRLKVLQKYSGDPPKCACCGERHVEFLTVDHIHGGGHVERKKLNRSGLYLLVYLLKKDTDKSKYQILCYNCNCFKKNDVDRICPHKLNL